MPIHPKTKEKVSWTEFFRQWKKGMQQITPLQQCQIIQMGHLITFVGIIWGILFTAKLAQWWLTVVLIGALVVLAVQFLGNYQKKIILKTLDNQIKLAEEVENG